MLPERLEEWTHSVVGMPPKISEINVHPQAGYSMRLLVSASKNKIRDIGLAVS
jgi:hypothetical protein